MALWQRVFSCLMKLIILARMSHSNYHHFAGIYQLMNSVIRLHFCFIIFHPHQAVSLKRQSFKSLEKFPLPKCGQFKIHDTKQQIMLRIDFLQLGVPDLCTTLFHYHTKTINGRTDCTLIHWCFFVYRLTTMNKQINFSNNSSSVQRSKTILEKLSFETAAKSLIPFCSPNVKLLDNFTWSTFCMKNFFLRFNLVERQHGTETFLSAFSCFMTQFSRMHFPSSFPHSMEGSSCWKVGKFLEHALKNQNKSRW